MPLQPMISVAGIRGIVGDSLVPETFLRYVLAFATLMDGGDIVVGGDSRLSRQMMRHLAFAGLASAGSNVHDLGLVPTPTVGMMIRELSAAGGIAITASHNPAQWNAYKFFGPDGCFLDSETNARLLEIAASGRFRRASYRNIGFVQRHDDAIERHIERVLRAVDVPMIAAHKFKVVVDCVNGVGGLIMRPLLEHLGCQATLFDTDVNAEFPRNPEPLPENLVKLGDAVRAAGADIGIAVDPDVDRLAIVDETGRAIGEERTIVLAAESLLQRPITEGGHGPLVVNLSTTRAMDDVAKRHNVPLYRTKIGEAYVVARLREAHALVGGEGNGGVIYPPVHLGRDAATGVALVLAALASHPVQKMSELNSRIPDYVMVKTKTSSVGLDPSNLAGRMRAEFTDATELVTEDGVKAVFGDSWVHLRPSGTEPVIRIFAEAPTAESAQALIARVRTKILGKKPEPTQF